MRRIVFEADKQECLIPDMKMIGWSQFTSANWLGAHSHADTYELCYIKRGSTHWWVGDELFNIEPGEIFITWPDELHGGENSIMHPCELYWVQFSLKPEGGRLGLSPSAAKKLNQALQALPYRKCRAPETMIDHYERILSAHKHPDFFAKAIVQSSLHILIHEALQAFERSKDTSSKRVYSTRIQRAIHWFRKNIEENITIEEAAEHAGLKPSQFRNLFRKETGFSPIEYLTRIRIEKAKQLLIDTELSVTDVAFQLGFNTSQYFATSFRRVTGQTPRAFRKVRQEQSMKKLST
ncbi:AraC family transcriptional regulator [Rubellicoccus peritrichatus]|uniref:AraC family transcriptional regulator n=1 Tax=Rubellicoccus peritrichatus TaxID=3080537 RepID=A0AAQ3L7J5_9BACT|nr:AraC family transcriptional regulator [Puniceicoccus sp. CR14]WOO39294.1 AraC family transcriptional regulator [Puniceicoccus sp. CR14]